MVFSFRVLLVAFEQHSGFHRRFSKIGRFVRNSPPLFAANAVPVVVSFCSGVGGLGTSPRTTRERGVRVAVGAVVPEAVRAAVRRVDRLRWSAQPDVSAM